jgi:hypothetical protein
MGRNGKVGAVYAIVGKNVKTSKEDFYRYEKNEEDGDRVLSCCSCESDMIFLSCYAADKALESIKKFLMEIKGGCDVDIDSLVVVEFSLMMDNTYNIV